MSMGVAMVLSKFLVSVAIAGAVVGTVSTLARAEEYYARPPIILSPDLTEPWVSQLRPTPYRDVVYARPVPMRRDAPPIDYWRGGPPPSERVIVRAPQPVAPQRQVRVASVGEDPRLAAMSPEFLPTEVIYRGSQKAGTIIIDTNERHLYLVEGNGMARRYGVGVGRPGFEWAGEHTVTRKAEWPDWTPPPAMLKRQPQLPRHMAGGPDNPLGARAMYLGSTEYRIHGTSEPWTIGKAVSSGCIRMRNEDVEDLYERVHVGTKVIVM
jgi:lipoprotein-anchoring transpeptidase ErfK/SrfK